MLSVICRTAPISAFVEQLGGTTAGICASITLYILIYSAAVFLLAAILRKKRTSTGTEISEKGLLLETKL